VTVLGDKVIKVEVAPKVELQIDRSAVQAVQRTAPVEAREREREKS
jgi:hypothetical protein